MILALHPRSLQLPLSWRGIRWRVLSSSKQSRRCLYSLSSSTPLFQFSAQNVEPESLPFLLHSPAPHPLHPGSRTPALANLSTPLLASLGQRQIKPSFLPGVNHADQSAGRDEEKNPGEEECAANPARTDVPGIPGPALARPRKLLLSPKPVELHYVLPGPIIFAQKKIFLKKYKLLRCKIKVPLSGASG